MNRAFTNLQVRAVDEDERVIEGIASTGRRDRQDDELVPRGIVYRLPIPFLLDHAHDKVVGEVEHIEVSDTEIRFRARIPKITEPGPAKDLVDQAWSYLKHGLRKNLSVGFRPLAHQRIDGGGFRYTAWELLEISGVGVPAQPDARVTATRAIGDKSGVRVVKLGSKPRGGAVKLWTDDPRERYREYLDDHRKLNDWRRRNGETSLVTIGFDGWKMVEDMLDRRIPDRKTKRMARRNRGRR
jgi:uncharacterized protein